MARTAVSTTAAATIAGAIQVTLAAGFGGGGLVTLRHLRTHGELPMTRFGFRMFSGPFERLGPRMFVAVLRGFVGLCGLDLLAGFLLLRGRRSGYELGRVTAGPTFALSVGFLLPIMLVAIPVRLVLAHVGRRSLR